MNEGGEGWEVTYLFCDPTSASDKVNEFPKICGKTILSPREGSAQISLFTLFTSKYC